MPFPTRFLLWLFLALAGLVTFSLAPAMAMHAGEEDAEVPAVLEGAKTIHPAEVSRLLAGGAMLVDTRPIQDFLAERIPASVHVAYREESSRQVAFDPARDDVPAFLQRLLLFARPGTPLILYCNGPYCWKSWKAGRAVLAAGYQHVFWLRGGMAEWVAAGLPVESE